MDTFPFLGPLKGPLLGVSKLDSLLTFEEDVETKTDSTRLELLVDLCLVHLSFLEASPN